MKELLTADEYRKKLKEAIEEAKLRTNVTQIMEELGISRGNISGFLKGEDRRLSLKKCDALLQRLSDPKSTVSNQQKLSTYAPKKAATMLSNAFFNFSDIQLTPKQRTMLGKELEDWLKATQEMTKK